jgi:N-acetylglucosamine-6-phosphate deacetylase
MSAEDLHAVVADHVFDGTKLHQHAGVLIDGAHVRRILPRSEIPKNLPVRALPDGMWLVPGFIDLQVKAAAMSSLTIRPRQKRFP